MLPSLADSILYTVVARAQRLGQGTCQVSSASEYVYSFVMNMYYTELH